MVIRQVRVHENSRMWAFVEWSDENRNNFTILGGKEFMTHEEALEYSQGFEPDSYEWVEPILIKRRRLSKEREKLESRLSIINSELETLVGKG